MSVDTLIPRQEATPANASGLISKSALEFLNFRINEEEKSARIYENMALWLNNHGFMGASALWARYSVEELTHAKWAKDYLLSLGIQPELRVLPAQPTSYTGLVEIIKASMTHELQVTEQCKTLGKKALADGDFVLLELAGSYNKEQLEELGKMQNWLDQLEAFGTDKIALRLLDNAMAEHA